MITLPAICQTLARLEKINVHDGKMCEAFLELSSDGSGVVVCRWQTEDKILGEVTHIPFGSLQELGEIVSKT